MQAHILTHKHTHKHKKLIHTCIHTQYALRRHKYAYVLSNKRLYFNVRKKALTVI